MKLSYHSYWLVDKNTDEEFTFDLKALLRSFCQLQDNAYKNRFTHDEERVFLKGHVDNTQILFTTRNKALIRKLNTENYNDSDIRALLQNSESLVFPSYVHVSDGFLAYASTSLAARTGAFFGLVNDILLTMSCDRYEARFSPIMAETTFDEAVGLAFIGRTHVSVSAQNTLGREFLSAIGKDIPEDQIAEIDGIDIILRPRFKQNIHGVATRLIGKARGAGLQKAHFKGKSSEEQARQLEMYLETQGAVFDTVQVDARRSMHAQIQKKISENEQLQEQLEKLNGKINGRENVGSPVTDLYSVGSWTARLRSL